MTELSLNQVLSTRRTIREFESRSIPLNTIERLLWAAYGKTDHAGKRTSPSAHALSPLRLFVSTGNIEDFGVGLYSVDSEDSGLNLIVENDLRADLEEAAIGEQPWIGSAACIISICADFITPTQDFSDQEPYGRRGTQYVYIEAGATAQNLHLQATAEGLGCVLVAGFKDEATSKILQLASPNAPILHLCVGWPQNS